jgi:hypothetical protein
MYDGDSGFEPFSRKELGFISISCVGVVMVPLLFLIVSQVQVSSFLEKVLIAVLKTKLSYMFERFWGTENKRKRWTLRYLMNSSLDARRLCIHEGVILWSRGTLIRRLEDFQSSLCYM